MPTNRHALRATLTFAGIVALSILGAVSVAAAIGGSLSQTQARPGDRVTLTAAYGPAGKTQTVYLISTLDLDRQIARFGHQVCNTSGQHALGTFRWDGGTGSMTFTVPNVGAGLYNFQVQVRDVSPDCWRIASQGEALVLTVIARTGAAEVPGPTVLSPLAALLLLATAGLGTAAIVRLTRRRPN
jgi:hypothetical protein